MKLKSVTLKTFTTLHTWVGLAAGLALFVAFYAGAITVFHHELRHWQAAGAADAPRGTLADMQRLLDAVLERHPAAREHVGMMFPGDEAPQPIAYWQDAQGAWLFATPANLDGSPQLPQAGLSELINELHYALGIPVAGIYVMGIVSLLYGLALISGVVIHLPQLAKDLFALRPGRNLKRYWQDAHNVIGVLSLPFHAMFAVTGALLCLMFLLMTALNPLIFDGKLMAALPAAMDTYPLREKAPAEAPLGTLAHWRGRAIAAAKAQGLADFEPAYLKLRLAGNASSEIEITGASPRSFAPLGAVALDASTGDVLRIQLPGARDANHATLGALYALHFGEYGNAVVRWLYFLLGLGGAFLFYSGNLLWIETRRKRRQEPQARGALVLARLTVGVCLGLCVAISAAFVAAPSGGERWTCFASWAACIAWAAWRRPIRAAQELLWLAAVLSAFVPVAHGIASGWWLWRSAAAGQGALLGVDLVALAMAATFGALAHATARRARDGDRHSVWAG
ncbi:MAG TPA: PepSY-associated TM helix domain-containing protein [Tahibacter sp.]|uniref:PepSY-associated TM helix domain-containing protein n=1 Tax=Tahibacter sp. TaxID=2056211 RepID=UPI002B8E4C89|nr:PepSY-associated TM helix domain-containing protein [Tahibacter sp.]HSX59515.1 PepSY-associated TM helix domain-containing protein [Tahibacter sp.]